MPRWNRATQAADFVVDLFEDGTYRIVKNKDGKGFKNQHRRVWGIFPERLEQMMKELAKDQMAILHNPPQPKS